MKVTPYAQSMCHFYIIIDNNVNDNLTQTLLALMIHTVLAPLRAAVVIKKAVFEGKPLLECGHW